MLKLFAASEKPLAFAAESLSPSHGVRGGSSNAGTAWVFDIQERLKELSAKGDELERPNAVVDSSCFVPHWSKRRRARTAPRVRGYPLSDEPTEYLTKDRLSVHELSRAGLADTVPDANTIWTFR
jgi:transposase, IS5 family